MSADINDKFTKVGLRGTKTTLVSPGKGTSDTSVTLNNPANWETSTSVYLALYIEDPTTRIEMPGTYTVWKGIVVGSQITSLQLEYGTNQPYPAGAIAVIRVANEWANELVDGILVSHNQDGTLKNGSVTTAMIADNSITAAKIPDSAIPGTKLTDNSIPSSKLDLTTLRKTSASFNNILLTTTNATKIQEVTMNTKKVAIRFDGHVADGNSGAARAGQLWIYRDGVKFTANDQFRFHTTVNAEQAKYFSGTITNTDDGASHTYALYIAADTANSTRVVNSSITVEGIG